MGSLFNIDKLKEQALAAPQEEYKNSIDKIEKFYKAKLNIATKEIMKLTRDFNSLKKLHASSKNFNVAVMFNKYQALKKQIDNTVQASKRTKTNLHKVSLEHIFLRSRVIKIYGPQAYLDLLNSVDNPRPLPLKDLEAYKSKHGLK